MTDHTQEESALSFPCEIDIKVFARARDSLEQKIQEILEQHIEPSQVLGIRVKQSNKGKYRSLSCKIHATNREEIDNLYKALTSHPQIIMVL